MRILFCGHQKWACLTLEALIKEYSVLGVITETDDFESKHRFYYDSRKPFGLYQDLKMTAGDLGLQVFQPKNINDSGIVEFYNPDLVVCVSYHRIIRKPLLDKFRFINSHNSFLPEYRGLNPIGRCLADKKDYSGVTVHFMDEGVDTGNVLVQQKVPVLPGDGVMSLMKRSLPFYAPLNLLAIHLFDKGYGGVKQDG